MRLLRLFLAIVLALSFVALASNESRAQPKGPARPAVLTPYATITISANQGGQYFNTVKPTLEFRALAARQEAEIGKIEKTLTGKPATGLSPSGEFEFSLHRTGHRVYFSNLSHYYPATGGK